MHVIGEPTNTSWLIQDMELQHNHVKEWQGLWKETGGITQNPLNTRVWTYERSRSLDAVEGWQDSYKRISITHRFCNKTTPMIEVLIERFLAGCAYFMNHKIEAAGHTSISNQEFQDFSRDIGLLSAQKEFIAKCIKMWTVEMQIWE